MRENEREREARLEMPETRSTDGVLRLCVFVFRVYRLRGAFHLEASLLLNSLGDHNKLFELWESLVKYHHYRLFNIA